MPGRPREGLVATRHIADAMPRGTAQRNKQLRSPEVEAAVAEVCDSLTDRGLFRAANVVVKPNVFMPHAPATTDPRVTAGVVAWLLDAGAAEVTVAEESSISTHIGRRSNTAEALRTTGYDQLIDSFGSPRVRLAELRSEGTVRTKVEQGMVLQEVDYPALLAEADRFVNVPILKYHLQTGITCAVKNTWAAAAPLQRMANHCWDLAKALLDVHTLRPPDLTVVDALQPLTRDHSYGDPLDWRLIMASTDSIALDALGAHLLGFEHPLAIETTRLGAEAGLGVADLDRITVEGLPKAELPRAAGAELLSVPAEFPPLEIEWHCGERVGPGCVAYVVAGLRSVAAKAPPEGLGRWQILIGEQPPEPAELADRALFVGACSMEGEAFRNVQRRMYLARRADDVIVVPGCPPMALRTEMLRMVGLD
jgi:uncharacterized protein (DUF362 family)